MRILEKIIIVFFIIPIEIVVSTWSHYTINETAPVLFYIVIFFNIPFLYLIFVRCKRIVSIFSWLSIIVIYLFTVGFNIFLIKERDFLKEQSEQLILDVLMIKDKTGKFPQEINRTNYDNRISYFKRKESFEVVFYVFTRNTCYQYTPKRMWYYYPD